MGVNFSHLPFYDLCHALGAIQSPIIALGSLEIHEPAERIRNFAQSQGCIHLAQDLSLRSLFLDRYSVAQYLDCDLNDKAEMSLDLAKPIPADLRGRAMTVLESGTIEHIFDIGRVFQNIHELTSLGGAIIHCAPLTWHEHGYYNFNPRLFTGVAEANGYQLVAEAFHFSRDVLDEASRKPTLYVTFDGQGFTSFHEKIGRLMGETSISNSLYFVAHKKIRLSDFCCPYDVSK